MYNWSNWCCSQVFVVDFPLHVFIQITHQSTKRKKKLIKENFSKLTLSITCYHHEPSKDRVEPPRHPSAPRISVHGHWKELHS